MHHIQAVRLASGLDGSAHPRTGVFRRRVAVSLVPALVFAFVLLVSPSPAHATCTQAPSVTEAMGRSPIVFVAEAQVLSDASRVATMEVVEIWKGDVPRFVNVLGYDRSARAGTTQDRIWEVGETYLVISETGRVPIVATICSGTVRYAPSGEIPIAYAGAVGTTEIRLPTAGVSTGGQDGSAFNFVPWLIALAVVLVLALAAVRMMKRRSLPDVVRNITFEGAFGRSGQAELLRRRTGAFSAEKAEAQRKAAAARAFGRDEDSV